MSLLHSSVRVHALGEGVVRAACFPFWGRGPLECQSSLPPPVPSACGSRPWPQGRREVDRGCTVCRALRGPVGGGGCGGPGLPTLPALPKVLDPAAWGTHSVFAVLGESLMSWS